MFGDLALIEDDVLFRIDPAGDEGGGDLARIGAQGERVLRDRDRVQIDDAIKTFIAFLQLDEFDDGAEIVAEMQIAGGLHAGEDALFDAGHGMAERTRVNRRHLSQCSPARASPLHRESKEEPSSASAPC